MATVVRELEQCIFCDGRDMTEEHLIADWAHRAFVKSKKPERRMFAAATVPGVPNAMRFKEGDPIATAKVLCRDCNNGWLSRIDKAAAEVLKPLVRGERTVKLDKEGQRAAAAWIFKCALILDAADHGADGPLAGLREQFKTEQAAPPRCVIFAGPSKPPATIEVGPDKTQVNLWRIGSQPADGVINLTINVKDPETGEVTPGTPKQITNPGYQIMVGALWAYIWGWNAPSAPVSDADLVDYQQVWPALDKPVTLTAASLDTRPPQSES